MPPPVDQIQARPGEKARHGIQVGTKSFTADASGFKGNGTASAEGSAHSGYVAKLLLTKFSNEFR